ncbi:MAG: hypothetical protein PUB24_02175 [Lachnospiraceae bacterium]|nr:hypothetical protein [Lachnospiraceae bacterium]
MEVSGKVASLSKDWVSGKFLLTLEVNETAVVESQIDELKGFDKLKIKVAKWTNKRSLDANAYFHVLVGKIADAMPTPISKAYCKNFLLGKYGQREMQDGKPIIISVISSIDMMEREDIHTIIVGYGNVDGKEFTHYAVIRGSHTYDSKEMSVLIDGTVEEAKALGIETLTPEELNRMMEHFKKKEAKSEKHITG